MRILITNSSDIYSGGEVYVLNLGKKLKERGHNVIISCLPDNPLVEKAKDYELKVIPISFLIKNKAVEIVWKLYNIIRNEKIDIVHTNVNYDRTYGAEAAKLATIKNVAGCHSLHSIQHNPLHWVRNNFWIDHFITDGEAMRQFLISENGIPEHKITTIYLGVDLKEFDPDKEDGKIIRREFNINFDAPIIGIIAHLTPFKGHKYFLQSAKIVQNKFPDAKFLIVGDGELKEELKDYAKSLGLEKSVIFTGFRNDLATVISACDICVLSSLDKGGEAFPLAVVSSMAMAKPIVATKVGEVPMMVEDGYNGFIVPPQNPEQMAEKIGILLNDKDLRIKMGKTSRKKVEEKLNLDVMTDEVEKVYRKLLK